MSIVGPKVRRTPDQLVRGLALGQLQCQLGLDVIDDVVARRHTQRKELFPRIIALWVLPMALGFFHVVVVVQVLEKPAHLDLQIKVSLFDQPLVRTLQGLNLFSSGDSLKPPVNMSALLAMLLFLPHCGIFRKTPLVPKPESIDIDSSSMVVQTWSFVLTLWHEHRKSTLALDCRCGPGILTLRCTVVDVGGSWTFTSVVLTWLRLGR